MKSSQNALPTFNNNNGDNQSEEDVADIWDKKTQLEII